MRRRLTILLIVLALPAATATAAQAAVYKDNSGLGGGRICDGGVLRYKAD